MTAVAPGPLLIVEDSPSDLELAMRTLRKQSLVERIEVVRDGAAALDFLFCRGSFAPRRSMPPPKAILLDLKLPKVTGIEVLRQIKSDDRTRQIPVIAFSSSAQQRDIEDAYRMGVNSYIVKPVAFELYAKTVILIGQYWLGLNQPAH